MAVIDSVKSMLFFLPRDLHSKFKIKLAQEGRTAKEFFLSVVKIYVEENGKKGKSKKSSKKS